MRLPISLPGMLLAACGAGLLTPTRTAAQGPTVHTIAPSASTKREAGRIIRLCRWTDTASVADADLILVVVRSSRVYPMAPSYDNLKWLRDEAQSLLNDSGAQYHVYFYHRTSTSRYVQETHRSYDAVEDATVPDPSAQFQATANSGLNCGF